MPAYKETIGTARGAYESALPGATNAAQKASNVADQTGDLQQALGTYGSATGMAGLSKLFGPDYEKNQIDAALQSGRESARESQSGQNAMYGAAGGLGSSRQALADSNMASLNAQRQSTAAADAQAKVQANQASAAQALFGAGQSGLSGANQAASARIGYAGTPQDVAAKYASVIFGTPQGNTTPNFANTQSTKGNSKSSGLSL
jgi:hypothetical protein